MPAFTFASKTYCLLTKPGIIFGNAITTAGGFALASKGHFNAWLFLATLVGLCLVIASACVFNNWIDRDADKKMARTKNRALARGLVAPFNALAFALGLGLLGTLVLWGCTNELTVALALFGFFTYVILYSYSKYRSIHGTLIGSVAGAIPPVVGYCAVSNRLDTGACILFAMIVLWQMPHFYAIAIYRLEEYAAASIPVLPLQKTMRTTKLYMLLYIAAFTGVSFLLPALHYVGYTYLIGAALLGVAWWLLCIQGFWCDDDRAWARKMFVGSLVVVVGVCALIVLSVRG